MRQLVTAVVVAVLVVGAVLGGRSVLDRLTLEPDPAAAAEDLAAAWAAAAGAGDVGALADLADDRVDLPLLGRTTEQAWDALGGPPAVEVVDVTVRDARATARLRHAAALGEVGAWTWDTTLPLQRAGDTWTALWEPASLHPGLSPGWGLLVRRSEPPRAALLDREGRALAGGDGLVEVGVVPARLPARARVERVVADALPEALPALRRLLDRDVAADRAFHGLVTVDTARAEEAWPLLVGLTGVERRPADVGSTDTPLAADVLGRTTEQDGRTVGASGLQALLDDDLVGSTLVEVLALDDDGREREVLARLQLDPAPPVTTTVDRDVQQALQDVLLGQDRAVGVAVVDVPTGGLVATASAPATGYARALEGSYPPGPAGALVAVAAALLDGTSPTTEVGCATARVAGGVQVVDPAAAGGARPLGDALGDGCRAGVAALAAELGAGPLTDAQAALGLDVPPGLPVPSAGWRGVPADADASAVAAGAAGQGRVTSSTVAAAGLVATVARGVPVAPFVLAEEPSAAGEPLPAGVAAALRGAVPAGAAQLPGVTVRGLAGGTVDVSGDPAPATGWWVGWVAGGGPELALAVTVEGDDGAVASRVAQRLLRAAVSGAGGS